GHADVRDKAGRALVELAARKEFGDAVLSVEPVGAVPAGRSWRGLEQSAILLAQLGHEPAAGRLVELLEFDGPEVFVAAAWALRKLAVPETLPGVLKYLDAELARQLAGKGLPGRGDVGPASIDHQLSQLSQLLGRQKYAPADGALRKFIPLKPRFPEARAAAIWALGLIHQGKKDSGLAKALLGRLNDTIGMPPEDS